MSALIAAHAASLMAAGAGKSGKPCDRLTPPYRWLSRVISRMTDSVNCVAFFEPVSFDIMLFCRNRHRQRESRPTTGGAVYGKFTPMRLHERAGDREPEARPFGTAALVEAIENVRQLVCRDPRPAVGNADRQRRAGDASFDRHGRPAAV